MSWDTSKTRMGFSARSCIWRCSSASQSIGRFLQLQYFFPPKMPQLWGARGSGLLGEPGEDDVVAGLGAGPGHGQCHPQTPGAWTWPMSPTDTRAPATAGVTRRHPSPSHVAGVTHRHHSPGHGRCHAQTPEPRPWPVSPTDTRALAMGAGTNFPGTL